MTLPVLLKDLTPEQKLRVLAMDFVGDLVGTCNLEPWGVVPFIEHVEGYLRTGKYEVDEEKSGQVKDFPRPVKD